METIREDHAGNGADCVGEPVVRIVSGASGAEGLFPFIESTDDPEHDDGYENASPWMAGCPAAEAHPCGEKGASAHVESEVKDLIDVGNLRRAFSYAVRIR